MDKSWRHRLLQSAALAMLSGPVAAVPALQDLAGLTAKVVNYLQAELGPDVTVSLDRLDPRLKLPQCPEALSIFPAGKPVALGQNTLAVRCEGTRPWTVYVGARVGRAVPVLVTRHPLAIGASITADDLAIVERDAGSLRAGGFDRAESVIGKIVARPIGAGAQLTKQHVESAQIIRRGQAVTIRLRGRGIAVAAAGKALTDGAIGDRIRVENRNSRRIVEGVVGAEGVIEVAI